MEPNAGVDKTSPCVHSRVDSRVDSNAFTMGNPMSETTLTLCQSRLYPPVRDFGFGLSLVPPACIRYGYGYGYGLATKAKPNLVN
jgi:hypothetical protein